MHSSDIDILYRHCWSEDTGALLARLHQSLNPRSPTVLYDTLATFQITQESTLLDIGCGWGVHSCDLAARFGCQVTGIDLAPINVERARQLAQKMEIGGHTTFLQGEIQALPLENAQFDFIWCYDMIEHVPDVVDGLRECARVLKPEGTMLLQTAHLAHHSLAQSDEVNNVYETLHICQKNLEQTFFEKCLHEAGWQIEVKEQVGSEWIEYFCEQQDTSYGNIDPRDHLSLLHFSRLRRNKEQLVKQYGQAAYNVVYAIQFFQIQQILGNINTAVYCLKKRRG